MSSNSSSWEPELLESQLHGIDPENGPLDESAERVPAKRGPKKLPSMWSRVICVGKDIDVDHSCYHIEEDMAVMAAIPRPPRARRAEEWAPLFLPTAYAREHVDISLENYRLGEKRLRTLGVEISKHRQRLREMALTHDKNFASD